MLVLATVPVLVLACFYPIENWRGKRAWEQCQRELAAKGEVLDWDAFIPPPVPEEQNFFKAPRMAEWFVARGSNDLVRRLEVTNLLNFCGRLQANAVVKLSVVTADEPVDPQQADLVLRYEPPVLRLESAENSTPTDPRHVKIPAVEFRDVPLRTALEVLARQAAVNYVLDPRVNFTEPGHPGPLVTFRWEQVTAFQVLIILLNNHGLQWIDDPKTDIGRIQLNNPRNVRSVYVDARLRGRIQELIQHALPLRAVEVPSGQQGETAQGLETVRAVQPRATPARVLLKADRRPSLPEVVDFFPTNVDFTNGETLGLQVEAVGDGFQVLLHPSTYSATDYLAWSDQFAPDFAAIREALQRPGARLDADHRPTRFVQPNYTAYRLVAQTLSQRAQYLLLLDRPDEALRELTLIHKLSGTLEGRPNTLVAAVVETAISGSYVEVVAEGLRRRAWREPQLSVIQQQLRRVNLLPLLVESLRSERAGLLRALESGEADVLAEFVNQNGSKWQFGLMHHRSWLPRGWSEQNKVVLANLQQTLIESLDITNQLVRPATVRRYSAELKKISKGFRPHTFVARRFIADFSVLVQMVACKQTCLDEAEVACALERYRLAVGELPETLEALCPRLLDAVPPDIIGGQPLKYRREGNAGVVVYSVGWNETDERGVPSQSGMPERYHSDWVWQTPGTDAAGQLTAR